MAARAAHQRAHAVIMAARKLVVKLALPVNDRVATAGVYLRL